MDNKVQEITEKIYREGVEKGQAEAQKIVETAEAEKAALIKNAQQEAEKIVADAKRSAEELNKNTRSELQLYSKSVIEALKSEVCNLIAGKISSSNVQAFVSDKAFMQKLIVEMAKEWVKKEELVIQTAESDSLLKYFEANAKDLLNKGVKIEKIYGKDTAFTILPSNGSYKVTFGEEEFISFFKEFLRPQLVSMLF